MIQGLFQRNSNALPGEKTNMPLLWTGIGLVGIGISLMSYGISKLFRRRRDDTLVKLTDSEYLLCYRYNNVPYFMIVHSDKIPTDIQNISIRRVTNEYKPSVPIESYYGETGECIPP